jgi:prefoldin beta subunit
MATKDPGNPGNVLASAIDAEMAKFRQLQEALQKLQDDLQVVMGQQAENDMVLQEMSLLSSDDTLYKQIGPVLIKQNLEDSQETVKKRLEFINGEKKRLETKIESVQSKGNELAAKVQKMQANLQQTTAEAIRAIQEQHNART